MPAIDIRGKSFEYDTQTVISFAEGIIGFPSMKNCILVNDPEFEPFLWLASVDDDALRFVIAETKTIFPSLDFGSIFETTFFKDAVDNDTIVMSLVKVSSDWRETTFNLKAPILINPHLKKGVQVVLSGSELNHDERIPE